MKNNGYIAISSVLIVGVVVLAISVTVIVNGINEVQSAFSGSQREKALALVNGCVRDGLIRLNRTNSVPATIILPEGSCTATINSRVGNRWDITFSGTFSGYTKNMKVNVTRTGSVTINSWQEI